MPVCFHPHMIYLCPSLGILWSQGTNLHSKKLKGEVLLQEALREPKWEKYIRASKDDQPVAWRDVKLQTLSPYLYLCLTQVPPEILTMLLSLDLGIPHLSLQPHFLCRLSSQTMVKVP